MTESHIKAINDIADAVRSLRARNCANGDSVVTSIKSVAATVTRDGGTLVGDLRSAIRASLLDVLEPATIGWNPLQALECGNDEVAWTNWLCTLLGKQVAKPVQAACWRALVDGALLHGELDDSTSHGPLATEETWRAARDVVPDSVDRAAIFAKFGWPDLAATSRSVRIRALVCGVCHQSDDRNRQSFNA